MPAPVARRLTSVRRYLCLGATLFLTGCGSAQVVGTPVRDTGVTASCAGLSPAAQFATARLVFVGRVLPGPTADFGGRRVLVSPARMQVERYLKGRGPATVSVDTEVTIEPGGVTGTEDRIEPRVGERWEIYTSSRRQPFDTSICAGSGRVASAPHGAEAALGLWRTFPVDAKPRPIVPLGEGLVVDPETGFRTVAESIAYQDGHFALHARLPGFLVLFGSLRLVSAATALDRLRAHGVHERDNFPPLAITAVRFGTATFVTDRGREALPAWRFYFRGASDPASVLAVAPPDVFMPPLLHRFTTPVPGAPPAASATVNAPGTTITISFAGPPAGTGPCQANYRASAVGSRQAVAFTITSLAAPVAPGQACPALAVIRTVALHLERPLGARVLISAADGGAIEVTARR